MSNHDHNHELPNETDVLIIGAGPGGYVAAIRAGQLDYSVTLVEKDAYGGTCLNYGCIPSKALISATDVAHQASTAEQRGVHADPDIDPAAMNDWKDGVVSQLTDGVENLCRQSGVELIDGRAEFVDETTANIHPESNDEPESLTFEHAIIATGSRAIEIPGFEFDGERILNSRHALALESVPESLLIVGAGYIGMELSSVYAKAGADVTVVEMLADVLPNYEDDISAVVRNRLESIGVDFHFGEQATEWEERDGDGIVITTETEDGEQTEYEASQTLVAVGREPVTDTVGLEAIGIETNEDGFIKTDDRARTNHEHVFAIGDVAGEPLLAHKGMMEGEIAAEVIAGKPAALDYQAIPAVVFTDPEIGTVGLSEAEAQDAGYSTTVGKMPLQASGRALTLNDTDGFVRVVAESDMGYLLGGQIVAPEASELIGELGLALEMGATLEDIIRTIHTHPTLSEAVREAAANARGHAIHRRNS
ncbi:dihydrolipoyl dehydrogenase [Halocatena marina]|uniref:dihydrolipoyl dehydrogenase n=1 Tax=Halocatena marina TaxID=2934937 RepID=UPI00200EE89C|nr:dihydrolipoyl dehydrogenase [Halocatena marina]